ncbi:MAG: helix-turn-helix domain-containing protein [Candidatus Acidiferrales bacterium]
MNEILGPEKILTPQELADRLKVPVSWIYEKTRSRSRDPLPVIRLGRYMRFDWPDIVEWIERHRQVA